VNCGGEQNMGSETTRRQFIFGSTALAMLGAIPYAEAVSSERPGIDESSVSPIRLGVASYSFRKFGSTDVIKFMKELNTPYLNAKDMHLPMTQPAASKQAADEFRNAGITLTAVGTVYFSKDHDDDIRQKFDCCRAAGIRLIVAGPTPEVLPRLEKFVKEYDIKIAIHNHGPEDKYFPTPEDALKAVDGMDPRMGLCVDVGHATRAGTDVPAAIHKIGARLFDIHMKDLVHEGGTWIQVPVGDGSLPIPAIFAALQAVHYPGFVDLEYEIHETDPMPGMIKSFAYMRGVLAGMRQKA
jgi:sugar phosphate isomerase/epimerase